MTLPAILLERMTGRRLAVAAEVSAVRGKRSMTGITTAVITDRPTVYIHDAGAVYGYLSREQVLEAEDFPGALAFADRSGALRGVLGFGGGVEAWMAFRTGTAAVADAIPVRAARPNAAVRFDTPLPVSVVCRFAQTRERIERQAVAAEPSLAKLLAGATANSRFVATHDPDRRWPGQVVAAVEHLLGGEFSAAVSADGQRLKLRRSGVIADVPLARVRVSRPSNRTVVLDGEMMVAGLTATAMTVHLPCGGWAERLHRAATGAGPNTPPLRPTAGVRETLRAVGRLADARAVDARVDAVLTDDALVLRERNGGDGCRFLLAHPSVLVAGTTERFIVATDTVGPVAVWGGAARFRERLVQHTGVREAARRTLAGGNFLTFLAGRPVVCRVVEGAVEVRTATGPLALPYADIRRLDRDRHENQDGVTLALQTSTMRFGGERQVVQAFARSALARLAGREFAARPHDLVAAVLGLERDYLAYSLFGPLFEVHAVLGGGGTASAAADPLAVPDAPGDRLALARAMASGLEPLRNHLEKVCYYFPSLLVRCDTELLPAGCRPDSAWWSAQERGYRGVLAGLNAVTAEVRGLTDHLLRIGGVDGRTARKPNYTMAAVSLAGGVLVNPAMLVGAWQNWRSENTAAKQSSEQLDAAGRLAERAVGQWNHLVLELLPAVLHHLLEGLFPLRLQLYAGVRRLLDGPQAEAVAASLARRLATLSEFLQWPADEAIDHPRAAITAAAWRLRDRLEYAGFSNF